MKDALIAFALIAAIPFLMVFMGLTLTVGYALILHVSNWIMP